VTIPGSSSTGPRDHGALALRRDVKFSARGSALRRDTKSPTLKPVSGSISRPSQVRSYPALVVLWVGYVLVGVYLIASQPANLDPMIATNYVVDVIAYFLMAGVFVYIFARRFMDLFDPVVIVSVVYISIYVLAPIHDIIAVDYYQFGVNTFPWGVKGTLVAVAGYLAMCFGYSLHLPPRRPAVSKPKSGAGGPKIAGVALAIWALAFITALVGDMAGGKAASYILSLGFTGEMSVQPAMDTPLGFAGITAIALIPSSIIYAHFGRSRWLNLAVQVLTFALLASQGFRYIVVIFVLSHVYVWYMKRKTTPRATLLVTALAVLILFSGAMGFYRTAMRTGGSVDWAAFGFNDVNDAVFGNLGIYKTYYAVVHVVPSEVPYGFGAQMFIYTAILFVPRAIWPSKPAPPVWDPIRAGLSDYAAAAGAAYPNIGEYYFEFGVLGVVVLMGLFGVGLNYVRARLRASSDVLDLVLYAVLVTATFQVVIRGYTPSNFYMLMLLAVPVVVVKRLSRGQGTSHRRGSIVGNPDAES
jgi:oligosaccharide repeat unit polymerase